MTVKTASTGPRAAALDVPAPSSRTLESVYDHLEQISGSLVSKVITLNVNNGIQTLNCFQLTGTVEILRMYGFVTSQTTFTNCTAVFFELDDSTAQVDITSSGITLSGLANETFFVKDAAKASTLALADNVAGAITEGSTTKIFEQFFLTQKTGANTFIRLSYASTDTPIAATFTIFCDFIALGAGTLVAV